MQYEKIYDNIKARGPPAKDDHSLAANLMRVVVSVKSCWIAALQFTWPSFFPMCFLLCQGLINDEDFLKGDFFVLHLKKLRVTVGVQDTLSNSVP